MEKLKIYADKYDCKNESAVVTNPKTALYNLHTLNKVGENSTPAFTAGKYLVIVFSEGSQDTLGLIIFVAKKNPDIVQMILTSDDFSTTTKTKFRSLIEAQNSTIVGSGNDTIEIIEGRVPGLVY